jgi:hypothetical protein
VSTRAGFKRTDVGIFPEDWEVRRFSDHFKIYAGGDVPKHSLSSTQSPAHPYPIFANALTNRGLYGYTAERRSLGDSVTVSARGHLGHAEYRSSPFFPIVRLLVLAPTGKLDAKFCAYAINELVEFAVESTGVPQLTAPQVAKYALAAPPTLDEQRAIAAALSDVDALLDGLDRLIAKKRDLKQAAMQQLLTAQTRLPGFSGEWEVQPFSAVLIRLNAKAHQIQTSDYQASGRYPVVDQGKEAVAGFSDREEKRFRCPDGGAIVFGDHTCFVKFIDFDFLVGADGTQILQGSCATASRSSSPPASPPRPCTSSTGRTPPPTTSPGRRGHAQGQPRAPPDIVLYVNGIAVGSSSSSAARWRSPTASGSSSPTRKRSSTSGILQHRAAGAGGQRFAGPALRDGGHRGEVLCRVEGRTCTTTPAEGTARQGPAQLCNKERLLELMRNFILFDGGQKKLPRFHQYFGVKAAQSARPRAPRAASSGTPRAAARAS